jgi:hypothetical protein
MVRADAQLCWADKVADVLDEEQIQRGQVDPREDMG